MHLVLVGVDMEILSLSAVIDWFLVWTKVSGLGVRGVKGNDRMLGL